MDKENSLRVFMAIPFPALVLERIGDHWHIVTANEAYLELTLSTKQDIVGKTTVEAFPVNPDSQAQDIDLIQESLLKVEATAQKNTIPFLRYDIPVRGTSEFEERYWIAEHTPVLNEAGEVDFILLSLQDITEHILSKKEQEENIRKQDQFRNFIEENIDALFSLDCQGKFLTANERLPAALEISREELLKMDFLPFCALYDRDKITSNFQETITGMPTKFEANFISAKGREMILEIALMPMQVQGKIEGAFGIAKDITGLRQTEQVVIEKKKFLEAHAKFISSLLEKELDYKTLEESFALIGKTVQADRMYYFKTQVEEDTQQLYISQKVEWNSDKAQPQKENPLLQDMPVSKVEQIMNPLLENKAFTATLSELKESELKKIFLEQDIKAMLLLPIFMKTTLYGFVGFDDCTQERQWNEDEISFLQSLTKNLSNALEKRTAEEAVRQREEELQQSEKKFKVLVQEGSDLLGILNVEGVFKFISETSNASWESHRKSLWGKVFSISYTPKTKNGSQSNSRVFYSKSV